MAYWLEIIQLVKIMNFPFNPSKFSLDAIGANPRSAIHFSERANFLICAAEIVSRESSPRFTPREWEYLTICAIGPDWPYANGPVMVMQAFVQSIRDSVDEALMLHVNQAALIQRLDTLTFAELFSVFEVLFRYVNLEPHAPFPRSSTQIFAESIEQLV